MYGMACHMTVLELLLDAYFFRCNHIKLHKIIIYLNKQKLLIMFLKQSSMCKMNQKKTNLKKNLDSKTPLKSLKFHPSNEKSQEFCNENFRGIY
jgi:hypothetical protein